ncbi:MAG: DUF222 domain-containing protein [Actinobacteria bacterium]|nr:MAG: DUF222 domain-containing protein [Actinomycetota bacterium]
MTFSGRWRRAVARACSSRGSTVATGTRSSTASRTPRSPRRGRAASPSSWRCSRPTKRSIPDRLTTSAECANICSLPLEVGPRAGEVCVVSLCGLDAAVATLRDVVGALEPGVLSGPDAARLVDRFAEAERIAAAGRALAARRVEETNQWRLEGHRSAASWVAAKTGTSLGTAAGAIETAKRLEELPATREAFVSGRLSEAQAREVASAAAASPAAESKLLAIAEREPLGALRDECRRVVAAAATDEVEWQERIRRRRYLHSWCDEEGAVCFRARYAPDDGAKLLALVEARQNVVFREARRAGRREPYAAYAADALLELVTGTAGPTKATLNLRVDHAAMDREGHGRGRVPQGDRHRRGRRPGRGP